MWTRFVDLYSGGGVQVEPYRTIYIEGNEQEAAELLLNRYDTSPYGVACECCGRNYDVATAETLEELLPNPKFRPADYLTRPDVLVIPRTDFAP